MYNEKTNTCCLFGHRKINESDELMNRVGNTVEYLIREKGVNTFLFGSKSEFNSLCYKVVTRLKKKYPNIKRIYVRAENEKIDDSYKNYILKWYDETYYPERVIGSGKACYVKRNQEMIDNSEFCVVYYDENYKLSKSGTKIAYEYAVKKNRKIINVFSLM